MKNSRKKEKQEKREISDSMNEYQIQRDDK